MPISTIGQNGLNAPVTLTSPVINTVTSASATALTLQSAGTTAVTIDTSQNVGIGTASPSTFGKFVVQTASGGNTPIMSITDNVLSPLFNHYITDSGSTVRNLNQIGFNTGASGSGNYQGFMTFSTMASAGGTISERMRITSSGALLVGKTTTGSNTTGFEFEGSGGALLLTRSSAINALINLQGSSGQTILFRFQNSDCGSISVNTGSTAYNTSSDYRLKNTIAPLVGALAKVAQLKPVTYKWNADNSYGEGFIAHELAEVCPLAVNGEKDAVDENGDIKSQGIDTSFLVATLTAAIQELKAEVDALKARLTP